jgi:hypothetical protein
MAPRAALLLLLGAALAPPLRPAGAEPAEVFALSFRRNLGGASPPACGLECAAARLPPAAETFRGSGGPVFTWGGGRALELPLYESELGCPFARWAAAAAAAGGPPASPRQGLVVFLLPAAAGGGSCAGFAFRAERFGEDACRLWVRDAALPWAGGLGACFGLRPALAAPGPGPGPCDPADALCPGAPPGLPLLPPHRRAFGVPAAPLPAGAANLTAGATFFRGPWLFFLGPGGASVRVYQAEPLAFRAELPWGGRFDDSAGSGLLLAAGAASGAGPGAPFVPLWAEFCRPGLGLLSAGRSAFARAGALRGGPLGGAWRLDLELVLSNSDRLCPPRGGLAALTFPPGAPPACNLFEVFVAPDLNAAETSYELFDEAGRVLLAGGGTSSALYCGPPGATLRLVFSDLGGDGLCCRYGGQSFYELRVGGTPLRRGGEFGFREEFSFPNSLVWRLPPAPSGGSSAASAAAFFPAPPPARLSAFVSAGWAWGALDLPLDPPAGPPALAWLAGGLLLALALAVLALALFARRAFARRPRAPAPEK